MNLDNAQKDQVKQWIQDGSKLSEIQARLAAEFGVRLTYMEVRLLMDDLRLEPKDAEPVGADVSTALKGALGPGLPEPPLPAGGAPVDRGMGEAQPGCQEPGDVTVSVDQVTRAGAVVSGRVRFSDGKGAAWYLDQYGRLAIAPDEQGYKPSQADLMLFQGELQSELGKMGY